MHQGNKILLFFLSAFISSQPYAEPMNEKFANITLKPKDAPRNIYLLEATNSFAGGDIGVLADAEGSFLVGHPLGPISKKLMINKVS